MKQKIKRLYGVFERQFRHHFEESQERQGATGDLLLERLERRLDNVVYRLGFADSRAQARQLVSHSFFTVNGKRMTVPSYETKLGDVIVLKTTKNAKGNMTKQLEILKNKKDVPHWLALDVDKLEGKVLARPSRSDVGIGVDAQMVVEYYSK